VKYFSFPEEFSEILSQIW